MEWFKIALKIEWEKTCQSNNVKIKSLEKYHVYLEKSLYQIISMNADT